MSFLIRITGPKENNETHPSSPGSAALEEMKMEELIHQIFVEENIAHDTWQTSRNGKYFVVEFPVIGRAFAEKILDRLSYYNVGKTEDSNIMVIDPAALVWKRPKDKGAHDIPMKHFQKFVNSLKSRLTVAQVYHAISNQGNFNFNYLCFLICAAIVADIALVTDSAACVFASMLLSPVMEPIMCIIFGLSLREKRMTMKGFRNTSVSLVICIIVGISFGIPAHFISMFQGISPYPTGEMSSRGEAKALIASVIVAAASGVSVSFAILSNSLAAMIGNAISLSLLPPSVNCGQFFLLAVIALIDRPYVMKKTETLRENGTISVTVVQCQYRWIKNYNFIYVSNACDAPEEFAILGVVSFCLTLLNIILIIITGYSVNRLKDLVPQSFTNDETRRFYTKDLKEVRDNYDCVHRLKAADLAAQAYQEYLRLSLRSPEGGYTTEDSEQLGADFQAVMEGIGQDPHLQTIGSWKRTRGQNFLAEFTRATEALAQGGDNMGGAGNGANGCAFPRISVSSDGVYRSPKVLSIPRRQASCIERGRSSNIDNISPRRSLSDQNTMLGGGATLGSMRLRRLRQHAAADNGDHEETVEQPSPRSGDADLEDTPLPPSLYSPPSHAHLPYQQKQRHIHTRFWQHLLNRRSSTVQQPVSRSLKEMGATDGRLEGEGNAMQWPRQPTPEDVTAVEAPHQEPPATGAFGFQAALSCVPSSESDISASLGEAPPSTGNSLRANNAWLVQPPSGPPQQHQQRKLNQQHQQRGENEEEDEREKLEGHRPISLSAYDVSAALPRNHVSFVIHKRSLASVSTIGGKFEVTPTIRKLQSTKNLGSYIDKFH